MPPIDLRDTVSAENQDRLVGQLGSFWTEQFQDREVVRQLMRGMEDQAVQADIDLKEGLLVARDLDNAPLYHREVWWRVVLAESDMLEEHPNALIYNPQNPVYDPDNPFYGSGQPSVWSFGLPVELQTVRCVSDRVTDARFVGYRGEAFFYRPGVIGFVRNPFFSGDFEVTEVDGQRAITVWLYMTDWDFQLIQQHYAIPTLSRAPTSEDYRKVISGLWEARVKGANKRSFYKVVSGSTGVPLIEDEEETVEWIGEDGNRRVVVTDQKVYHFPLSHVVTVAVGDRLLQGDSMTDALSVKETASLRSGEEPILVPPSYFAPASNINDPILFPNERVPVLDLGTDERGNRVVSFGLYGPGDDLIKYRDYSAAAGIARALDKRGPNAPTVPTGDDLKPTVNPAVELIAAHTRPNLVLITGDKTRWPASDALKEAMQRQIDQMVPPHGRVLVQDQADIDGAYDYSSVSFSSVSSSSSTVSDTSASSTSQSESSQSSTSHTSTSQTSTSSSISQSFSSTSSTSSVSDVSTSSSSHSSSSTSSSSSRSSFSVVSDVSTSSSSFSTETSSPTSETSSSSDTLSSTSETLSSQSDVSTSSLSSVSVDVPSSSSSPTSTSSSTVGSTGSTGSTTSSSSSYVESSSSQVTEEVLFFHGVNQIKATPDSCTATFSHYSYHPLPDPDHDVLMGVWADQPSSDLYASDYTGLVFVTVQDSGAANTGYKEGSTWRSADFGVTWAYMDHRFDAMVFKGGPGGFIVGFQGLAAYRSYDKGLTWELLSVVPGEPTTSETSSSSSSPAYYKTPVPFECVTAAVYDIEHDVFVCCTLRGIFHSPDNGDNWIPVSPLGHPFGPSIGGHFMRYGKGRVVVTRGHRLCSSVDGGVTWSDYYGHYFSGTSNPYPISITAVDYNPYIDKWYLFGHNHWNEATDAQFADFVPTYKSVISSPPTFTDDYVPNYFRGKFVFCGDNSDIRILLQNCNTSMTSGYAVRTVDNGNNWFYIQADIGDNVRDSIKLTDDVTPGIGTSSSSSSADFALDTSSSSTLSDGSSQSEHSTSSSSSSGVFSQFLLWGGEFVTSSATPTSSWNNAWVGGPETGWEQAVDVSQLGTGNGELQGVFPVHLADDSIGIFVIWYDYNLPSNRGFWIGEIGDTSSFVQVAAPSEMSGSYAMWFVEVPDGAGGYVKLIFRNGSTGAHWKLDADNNLVKDGTNLTYAVNGRPHYTYDGVNSVILCPGSSGRVLRSTDLGDTWSYVYVGNSSWIYQTINVGGQVWLACVSDMIYRSIDDGLTWSFVVDTNDSVTYGIGAKENGEVLFYTSVGSIWYSDDQGASWVEKNASAGFSGAYLYGGVEPLDDDGGWLLGVSRSYVNANKLFQTNNNGATVSIVTTDDFDDYRIYHLARISGPIFGFSSSSSTGDWKFETSSSSLPNQELDTSSSSSSTPSSVSDTTSTASSSSSSSSNSPLSASSGSPSSITPESESSFSSNSSSSSSASAVSASSLSSQSAVSAQTASSATLSTNSSRSSTSRSTDPSGSSTSSLSAQSSVSESTNSYSSFSFQSESSAEQTDVSSSSSADLGLDTSSSSYPSSRSSRSESSPTGSTASSGTSERTSETSTSSSSGALAGDDTTSSSSVDNETQSTSSPSSVTDATTSSSSNSSSSSSTADNLLDSTISSLSSESSSYSTSSSSLSDPSSPSTSSSSTSGSPSSNSPSSNSPSSASPSSGSSDSMSTSSSSGVV